MKTRPAVVTELESQWRRVSAGVSRILCVTLIAFSCTVFSGLYGAQGQGRDGNPSGNSDQVQSPNGTPPDEESRRRFELWKSCADLVHENGDHSKSALQDMLERPRNTQQLLQNLKLAWERDLLLQPSFYSEATLLKFFNGTKVTWNAPDPFFKNLNTELIAGSVASDAFPGVIIKLESNCKIINYNTGNATTESKAAGNGFLDIKIGSASAITLQTVRRVFGREARQSIDRGVDPHGNTYDPTEKGSVVYTKVLADHAENTRVELAFHLGFERLQQGPVRSDGAFVDDDRVTRISIYNRREHTVGTQYLQETQPPTTGSFNSSKVIGTERLLVYIDPMHLARINPDASAQDQMPLLAWEVNVSPGYRTTVSNVYIRTMGTRADA